MEFMRKMKVVDMDATAKMLKTYMDIKGLTVKDVSAITNVSRQVVYRWLNGMSMPSVDNLVILSDIFDVPIDVLIVRKTCPEYSIPEYLLREDSFSEEFYEHYLH